MLLGISSQLEHADPQDWAAKHVALGLKSVNFPVSCTDGEEKFMAYKKAADDAGLVIAEEEYTFQLEECACGQGVLDLELYARLSDAEDPRMPMIIEHLTTDDEYAASVRYVRERLGI